MHKRVTVSLALAAALLLSAGFALACPGAKGKHARKDLAIVSADAAKVVVSFTTPDGADAVRAIQAKFAKKAKAYNEGKAPCAKCTEKSCVFKVKGLKLATKNVHKGILVTATGSPKAVKTFHETAKKRIAEKAKGKGAKGCGGCEKTGAHGADFGSCGAAVKTGGCKGDAASPASTGN